MDSSTMHLVESSNDNCDNQQDTPSASTVFQTIALPSGRRTRNRLVKVAMYEHLASLYGGPPTTYHFNLYSEWAKHGWGIIITGNVAITDDHLTLGRDIILPPSSEINSENAILPFKRLAQAIHGIVPDDRTTNVDTPARSLAIMQLNHAGRQSSNLLGGRLPFKRPLAPSSIRVASSDSSLLSRFLNAFMFQLPTEMTQQDINKAINRFVEGAVLAYRAGFDGVQIHAAHGYLLAQFLSPKSNIREDVYSVQNALDIIQTIALLIRESTSSTFIICIKMNAAEYSSTVDADHSMSEMEERALGHLFTIATWGLIDFVEISGGDYEKPDFMMAEEVAKSQRQAFFANFSHKALRALESLQGSVSTRLPLILLTGGLKSLDLLDTALDQKHAHLLGIGRASVTCPELPRVVRERSKDPRQWDGKPFGRHPELRIIQATWITALLPRIKIIGAGVEMAWYVVTMRDVAMGVVDPALTRGGLGSIIWMWTPLGLYTAQLHRQRVLLLLLLAALPPFIAYLIQRIHI